MYSSITILILKVLLCFHINAFVISENSQIIATPWIATISAQRPAFSGIFMNDNQTYTFGCPCIFIDLQAVLTSFKCIKSYPNDSLYVNFDGERYHITEVIVDNATLNRSVDDGLAVVILSNATWTVGFSNVIYFAMTKKEINWDSCKLIQYPMNSRRSVFNVHQISFVKNKLCRTYINEANKYSISQNLTWSSNLLCSTLLTKSHCLTMRRYSPVICEKDNSEHVKYEMLAFSTRRLLISNEKCFVLFLNVVPDSKWIHQEKAQLSWERFSKYIIEREPHTEKHGRMNS